MAYSASYFKKLHKFSANNRKSINLSTKVGCFYCLKIFSPTLIKEWTGGPSECALCPFCSIDTLLDNWSVPTLSIALLKAMHKYWFKQVIPSSKFEKMIKKRIKNGKKRTS